MFIFTGLCEFLYFTGSVIFVGISQLNEMVLSQAPVSTFMRFITKDRSGPT